MVNFIKRYALFDELYITINYSNKILKNQKVKYYLEVNILEFLKDKIKFKWKCVENKKGQKRIQQLCYNNETKIEEKTNKSNIGGFMESEIISLL